LEKVFQQSQKPIGREIFDFAKVKIDPPPF